MHAIFPCWYAVDYYHFDAGGRYFRFFKSRGIDNCFRIKNE